MEAIYWLFWSNYWGRPIQGGQKESIFFHIGYTTIPSSVQLQISRQQLDKEFNLEPPKLRLYQIIKNPVAKIVPHIYSSLGYLSVIIEKSTLSIGAKLVDTEPAGTLDS